MKLHHALFSLHRYKSLARHVWQLVEAKDRSVRSVVEKSCALLTASEMSGSSLSVKLIGDQKRRLLYNRPTIDCGKRKEDISYEVKQCYAWGPDLRWPSDD